MRKPHSLLNWPLFVDANCLFFEGPEANPTRNKGRRGAYAEEAVRMVFPCLFSAPELEYKPFPATLALAMLDNSEKVRSTPCGDFGYNRVSASLA